MRRYRISKILPHIAIIISFMLMTFVVIDHFNSAMNFINNDATKILMFILSLVSVVNSILLIRLQRKDERRK